MPRAWYSGTDLSDGSDIPGAISGLSFSHCKVPRNHPNESFCCTTHETRIMPCVGAGSLHKILGAALLIRRDTPDDLRKARHPVEFATVDYSADDAPSLPAGAPDGRG